jgi:hypothetical protein
MWVLVKNHEEVGGCNGGGVKEEGRRFLLLTLSFRK